MSNSTSRTALAFTLFALIGLVGCGRGFSLLTGPTPREAPQVLADFTAVGILRVARCDQDGQMHVMQNSRGNRYDVWTETPLRQDQFSGCGFASNGYYTPIVFEAEVTARAVDGHIEIEAATGPQTEGGRFFLSVTPTSPELQAQLPTGAPLTERNRVTVSAEGDHGQYRIHVAIGPPVPVP